MLSLAFAVVSFGALMATYDSDKVCNAWGRGRGVVVGLQIGCVSLVYIYTGHTTLLLTINCRPGISWVAGWIDMAQCALRI